MNKMQDITNLFSTINSHTDNDWVYANLEKWEAHPGMRNFLTHFRG